MLILDDSLSTFVLVWVDKYNMSAEHASLHYLAIGLGSVVGLHISRLLIDGVSTETRPYFILEIGFHVADRNYYVKLYGHFKKAHDTDQSVPEWRIPPMLIGSILAPVGLFIYGWCAQYKVQWVVTDTGAVILSAGMIITFQSAQAYVTDTYNHQYAASAAAAGAFMRTIAGFGFPLFAPSLYETMGVGWGNTFLGLVTLVLAIPSPIALWFYGANLRAWSKTGLD